MAIKKLSFTDANLPQLCKGDILISEPSSKGYFWSDIQCIIIAKERAKGLSLSYNKDGSLTVENDWPTITEVDNQITLEEYAKEKGYEL